MKNSKQHFKGGGNLSYFIFGGFRLIFFQNKIIDVFSKNRFFNRFYWKSYRIFYYLALPILNKIHPKKYTRCKPFKIFWVNPSKIKFKLENVEQTVETESLIYGRIHRGDWNITKIRNDPYFEALKNLLKNGNSQEIKKELKKEGMDHSNIKQKLNRIETLKKNLESSYLTQRQLMDKAPKKTIIENNDTIFPELNEIQVVLNKEGELVWRHCGKHRLFISKIIELEKIPVIIQCRHIENRNNLNYL